MTLLTSAHSGRFSRIQAAPWTLADCFTDKGGPTFSDAFNTGTLFDFGNLREISRLTKARNVNRRSLLGANGSDFVTGEEYSESVTVVFNAYNSNVSGHLRNMYNSNSAVWLWRFVLMDKDPKGTSNTAIATVPHAVVYFAGRPTAFTVIANLADAVTYEAELTLVGGMYGLYQV